MPNVPTVELVADSLQLTFPYDPALVQLVKTLYAARWQPAAKTWSIPFSKVALDSLKQNFPLLQFGDNLKKEVGADAINQLEAELRKYIPKQRDIEIKDFTFSTPPQWHQKITFNFARALDTSAIFLEQGLGKTKIAIDLATWRFRTGKVHRVLYVAPNSVVPQWRTDDVTKHLHDDFNLVTILSGSTKDRIKAIDRVVQGNKPGWLIINYEALLGIEYYLDRVQGKNQNLYNMMVLDESSKIKHATSQRSKVAYRLGKSVKYRTIMTGTPITQSAEDAFSQYKFLDDRVFGPYATAFRGQYLMMGGFEMRQIMGYRNIGDFYKKLFSLGIRFTKDMCLDLPAKVYAKRTAKLDEETSKKYRQLEKECIAEFAGKQIAAPLVMTKLMKLSQVTGGFVYEQDATGERVGTHVFKKNPKLDVLEEILEEVLPKKVIVWCRFKQEISCIEALLKEMKIPFVAIHGDIKTADRGEAVRKFQEEEGVKVFVGQVDTAGLGITLTAASFVVYYSNTYSLEARLQSEDRCHRIGQTKSVTYTDILAETHDGKRTIDHDTLDVIKGKAMFANEVSLALVSRMVGRQSNDPIKNPATLKSHKKNSDVTIETGEEF